MSRDATSRLRQSVWNGSLPLEIRLHKGDCRTYNESDPYIIQFPRISYLGLLIHKLHAFFSSSLIYPDVAASDTWLSYEGVPLKWHYPLGLLYDLYSGAEPAYPPDTSSPSQKSESTEEERRHLPWRLTVHFSDYPNEQLVKLDNEDNILHDLFKNSVKEADYLRTGTGKTVMFLSKEDSTQLWEAVKQHDFALYNPINQKLLNPQGVNLRHLPVRLYLPHAASDSLKEEASPGSLRVVQSLVPTNLSSRQPQTIGTALNSILPTLFPSRRSALLAQAVLHGAVLPLSASVEELIRATAYLDGWLHIAVVMMG
ncbi:autophagy protein-like protein 5 [Cucurbitaria berberidis CBS 394.84]|uniref:Autophagy protein 5 n=1 Tax=Cucurbitaria berberidis CBS 394.84 TaxID=1168544 RepID=A0A9P4L929_9PLEO|nr:autophagy protein-like protein 5 [Cucurbitaria berberidis CBS 394.84]KAF1845794.1 autophagy protein-like protein 5 [Cucurbitaria berberidis CBS 394.84]